MARNVFNQANVHVQLLAEGELTPGLASTEFAARRQALADSLPPGAVALLPASAVTYMSGVVPYPYRQVNPMNHLIIPEM